MMIVEDLGRLAYRDVWKYQEKVHDLVLGGGQERLLLVEHPPVITLGRRPGVAKNLVASAEQLSQMGVEVVESDRGGDITFHGPGQIVAYPIIRLANHQLSVGGYVHTLEDIVIATLSQLGFSGATKDAAAVGVWIPDDKVLAKVCAIGVRIRKGISMHGIALNVETDLRYFELIIPCGLAGRAVTSLKKLAGEKTPGIEAVKKVLVERFSGRFG
jgi:lipoyl(octanoyl) transferase